MRKVEDLNVVALRRLITPRKLKEELPLSDSASETVPNARQAIIDILEKRDRRLLVTTGPCSIHDGESAVEYAERLKALGSELSDRLVIVMRTYFEKPRTALGWKGLINDPNLDGSYDVPGGLAKARQILLRIAEIGVATGTEMLDPIVPQYISDLISWASIGARTTESQTHREMASGLSMPIGFKNSTDGNLQVAINGMLSSRNPHHFLGIDGDGLSCVVETRGNPGTHIILRGGKDQPNYGPVSVIQSEEKLRGAGLPERIVIDCSHANCGKRPELQGHVLRDVLQQRLDGNQSILGVMIESNLKAGNQTLPEDLSDLEYGVSVTDSCIDWETTEKLLRHAHASVEI